MRDWLTSWICDIVGMFQSSIDNVAEIMGKDLQSFSSMWDFVLRVQDIVKPISYSLITIFFLIEFLKLSMKFDAGIKWEFILKVMTKFLLAKACIDFGPQLLEAIYSSVAGWINSVANEGYVSAMDSSDIRKGMKGLRFWQVLGFMVVSTIPALALVVCSLIIKVIAYTRLFELFILLAIMPIAFSFLLESEGAGNITRKFILNFAAVCLQGLLIVVCCGLYTKLLADGSGMIEVGLFSAFGILLKMLLGAIILVVSVGKCGQWAKSVLS